VTGTHALLDVEGTTTPIAFVATTLFPYAAAAIPDFLARHGERPEVADACQRIAADAEGAETALAGRERILAVVRRQMAADAKAPGLKTLQGLVWAEGYRSGALRGPVYPDVPAALRRWADAGRPARIYSSGSVLAQRLLFAHSDAGDLSPWLAGHYDTAVGPKREPASYTAIARDWGLPPGTIRFFTDQPAEAVAALAAGLQAVLVRRPGNAPLPADPPCPVADGFDGF
jgi:enolase-phosphatase E1